MTAVRRNHGLMVATVLLVAGAGLAACSGDPDARTGAAGQSGEAGGRSSTAHTDGDGGAAGEDTPAPPRLGPSRDLYDGDLGDPFILVVPAAGASGEGVTPARAGAGARGLASRASYVAFGTGDWGAAVPTAHSIDLVTWEEGPDALPELPSWAGPNPKNSLSWAPAVLPTANGYVLYISLPEQSSGLECIAAAVSAEPEGPYVDAGSEPFLCQRDLGGSIDATIVRDDEDRLHLLWKNDGNCCGVPASLWEQRVTDDGLHLVGQPHRLLTAGEGWQAGIVENPAAIPAEGGGWWLFYSGNRFDTAGYGTGLAYCPAIEGPCRETQPGPVLATRDDEHSPGGLDTFRDGDGTLWAVYHIWTRPPRDGIYYCCRALRIAPVLAA